MKKVIKAYRLIQIFFTPPGRELKSLKRAFWVRYFVGIPVTRIVFAWTDFECTRSIKCCWRVTIK